MNIKIVDSWLREYLETKAKPEDIARELSLTSVSVDRTEKVGNDFVYDIEVTTNRPDLMSVSAIGKEAATVLEEQGIPAKYIERRLPNVPTADISFPIEVKNNPELVNRIMAVVLEVEIGKSPEYISDRLEKSGIRSLNNLIDVTNYVMREIGHPTHVFDFDLLSKQMIIRESKPGEVLTTLDGKQYRLTGGDVVADNGTGEIIDLLGVMGTQNSVVQDNTRRILFFLDNINPRKIRQTSMNLGIRTEAAIINEKGIDPELMDAALKRGVELFKEIASGKVVSKVLDIYPNKPKPSKVKVSLSKINRVLGIEMDPKKSKDILEKLGFEVKLTEGKLEVEVPTIRSDEVKIPEDVIEEIARVYGYHKLPSTIPMFMNTKPAIYANSFYFEEKVKNAFKYWGYTEVYTNPMVSEDQFQGPIENAVKVKNPLSDEMVYLRNSLVPSLIQVIDDNKSREVVKIFEIANVYGKRKGDLPLETLTLSGIIKKSGINFFEIKGTLEQLFNDLGIKEFKFKNRSEGIGAEILIRSKKIGYIEILNESMIDFELNFEEISLLANNKKVYKPLAKFPAVYEDITFLLGEGISTEDIIEEIQLQNFLIREVSLKDQYENSRTFHITYQAPDRNLTSKEVSEIREQIIKNLGDKFKATVK